ncbi:unnamed protein product [Peronospora belbahrii]|uniref:Uncharacterized protein n=1 Tax=Peronospora belbahrii TaxID=622444 RepID=A0AAU9LBQ1_9STRA|nr:unnamed protein product [Peronospora belbahrii]CAH0521928.1 unnamed protein product [Peronospora belbahrii]
MQAQPWTRPQLYHQNTGEASKKCAKRHQLEEKSACNFRLHTKLPRFLEVILSNIGNRGSMCIIDLAQHTAPLRLTWRNQELTAVWLRQDRSNIRQNRQVLRRSLQREDV